MLSSVVAGRGSHMTETAMSVKAKITKKGKVKITKKATSIAHRARGAVAGLVPLRSHAVFPAARSSRGAPS